MGIKLKLIAILGFMINNFKVEEDVRSIEYSLSLSLSLSLLIMKSHNSVNKRVNESKVDVNPSYIVILGSQVIATKMHLQG